MVPKYLAAIRDLGGRRVDFAINTTALGTTIMPTATCARSRRHVAHRAGEVARKC